MALGYCQNHETSGNILVPLLAQEQLWQYIAFFRAYLDTILKALLRISDVKKRPELSQHSNKTIFYTGYEILNEELLFKEIVDLNGNQFIALDSQVSNSKFLFMKINDCITAIHLGKKLL